MKWSARASLTLLVVLLDEIIVAAIVLFVLWRLGIHLPLWVFIAGAVALGASSLILYKLLAPVLNNKQVIGPEAMIGLEGEVVKPLTPEGVIKVRGELWKAYLAKTSISTDEEVIVVGIKGLTLLVRFKNVTGESEEARQKHAETIPKIEIVNRGCPD